MEAVRPITTNDRTASPVQEDPRGTGRTRERQEKKGVLFCPPLDPCP